MCLQCRLKFCGFQSSCFKFCRAADHKKGCACRLLTHLNLTIDHGSYWKRESPMLSRGNWNSVMLQWHTSHLDPDETIKFPQKQISTVFYISSESTSRVELYMLGLASLPEEGPVQCARRDIIRQASCFVITTQASISRLRLSIYYLIWSSIHPSIIYLIIYRPVTPVLSISLSVHLSMRDMILSVSMNRSLSQHSFPVKMEKPFLLELKPGISVVFLYDKALHRAIWCAKSFSANLMASRDFRDQSQHATSG